MKRLSVILLILALLCPLVSCAESFGEPSAVHTVNDFSIELYENEGIVTRIKAVAPNGKSSAFKCFGTDFSAVDLNFDGYADLCLTDAEKEGQLQIWLFQPNSQTYTHNSALSDLIEPQFDSNTGQIIARIHKLEYYSEKEGEVSGYRETRAKAKYEFISGSLIQISESGIYHDSDGELYCVYEAEFVNGELIYDYGKEQWYYFDELQAAGYEW